MLTEVTVLHELIVQNKKHILRYCEELRLIFCDWVIENDENDEDLTMSNITSLDITGSTFTKDISQIFPFKHIRSLILDY